MKISDFPQDLEPRVGDIIEIEQGDVCFEVRIIGITADGYLCEQDNVQGAVLLEGVALDQDDVTDIAGYITEERVRLDPKCWKGKKIGNPKTKLKGGVRVNNCVPEGQEDIEESGLQYYTGVKKHGQSMSEMEGYKKTFTVVYYSPKTDRNVSKIIRAKNESDIWDQFKAKGIDVVSVKEKSVAEGSDVAHWRVEQSKATGRYYVVTGYTDKSRRVWKSKQGAADFSKKSDAEAKAQELNQGVAEAGIDPTLGPRGRDRDMRRIDPGPEEKYYFQVPFELKTLAKDMGLRWDPDKKKWFTTSILTKTQAERKFKPWKGVAEGSDNNVYFEVDSEKAYNHIMKKFRSVINWDGDTMVAPKKYWGAIQELAYSAGGEAIEVGNEQGVAEGKPKQLPTKGADYSQYDTDHLRTLLKPGILHRNEARFKALIRKELQKREQQGVAEDISSTKKKISKYEELALAANRAGDDAKCKQYQQKIQVLKQKMSQGVAEGSLNELDTSTLKSYRGKANDEVNAIKQKQKLGQLSDKDFFKKQDRLMGITGASKRIDKRGIIGVKEGQVRFVSVEQGVAEGSRDKVHLKTPKHGLADHPGRDTGVGLRTFAQTPEQDRCPKCNSLFKNHYKQGVAEGYTGRETKDGTWRVFKDGQAVAVAGPFNSRDEAHAWIKKHKQGVSEAKSLKKRVRVVQGEHAGKTGWIREIKHGVHSTAPKRYYVDIDGGGQADNLPASALRLLKDQSDGQKNMAEGEQALKEYSFAEKQTYMRFLAAKVQKYGPQSLKPEERAELVAYLQAQKMAKENAGSSDDNQFSLGGKVPATNEIPQDSTAGQDKVQAMVAQMKQRTIDSILDIKPKWERSDLELMTATELNQILRDLQFGEITEAEYQGRKVALGKPMAGDVAKRKVYVRKPNGKVVKVNFGDKEMRIKKSNPARRKSFRARHNCQNPGPKWKARYWSCRQW